MTVAIALLGVLVRDLGDGYQVVMQPDHGQVCGQLAAAWRYGSTLEARTREALISAATRHDDGWSVYERHPGLDEEGRPASFITAPVEPLLSSYRASVDVLEIEDPLAALLVSMHVSGLRRGRYGVMEGGEVVPVEDLQGPVRAFVVYEEERQRELARRLGVSELRPVYRLLQIFDVFSLHLGLADLERDERMLDRPWCLLPGPRPWSVRCDPWPFERPELHVSMLRRVVPGRRWEEAKAFRAALAAAPVEPVDLELLRA